MQGALIGDADGLAQALQLARRRSVYLIGGGGKSTLLQVLAEAACRLGLRVVATTTTKVHRATGRRAPALVIEDGIDRLVRSLATAPRRWVFAARAVDAAADKLLGYPAVDLDALVASGVTDLALVEADGAAGRALKAHAAHEPVIGARADLVIAVVGMDVVGAPFGEAAVHRHRLFAERVPITAGTPVTWHHVAAILEHERGYFARVPAAAELVVLLNKVETTARAAAAAELTAALRTNPRVSRVVTTRLDRLAGSGAGD